MNDTVRYLFCEFSRWASVAVLVFVLLGLTGLFLPAVSPATAQDSFAGFIVGLRDVCAKEPARACTRRVSSFLDSNSDNQVSLQELETLRTQAKSTVDSRDSGISTAERNSISIGLLALPRANLATVFAKFDANTDGGLSEDELFADFQLDRRPLTKIISDPDSVDWVTFAARFGKVGALVLGLLPPIHRD